MKTKRYLPVLIAVACFLALYHHMIPKLVHDWWTDPNYSHGFLVPVISGYLIWHNRKSISELPLKPTNWGLVLLCLSLGFYILAWSAAELFTMRFSMILVILSLIVFLAGWAYFKKLFLPVFYLVFMIPLPALIWEKIAFPLKMFVTKIAVDIVQFIGLTAFREGNIIHLPNTTLQVVDACSGIRSLTSLLALSAAFALISDHSRSKKIILFLSAVPIAIATNILRLSLTAVLAKYFGPQVAQGFLHEASGVLVFILALILLYLFHKLLIYTERSA